MTSPLITTPPPIAARLACTRRAARRPSDGRRPRPTSPRRDGRVRRSRTLEVFYGSVPRRPRRRPHDPQERDHRVHRPVRLRQDHGAALPQPHERPHPRRPGGGQAAATTASTSTGPDVSATEVRRRHRHGVPEAEPVPQEHLRQRGLRPKVNGVRRKGELDDIVEQSLRERRAVGRGEGPPQELGPRHVGRSAAAAVHRPHHRRRARRGADGRAVLGPRPDRHRPHRGPDAGAQVEVHDRDRHPQHAAGRPGERPHGVLHRRARLRDRPAHRPARGVRPAPSRSSPTPPTSGPRTTSPAGSDDRDGVPAQLPRRARRDPRRDDARRRAARRDDARGRPRSS